MLERLGKDRSHQITAKIDENTEEIDFDSFDVAIDFSTPEAAFDNITQCFKNGIPVVSGTTGWLNDYDKALEICEANKGAFIYASNFSLGVNLFFELNKKLAKMMQGVEGYTIGMEEIHHTQKVDAPSGTAITLAEGVIENHEKFTKWRLDKGAENEIPIRSVREGQVPGTHTISYSSQVDSIEIKHTAFNREGFALGALMAAEWLVGKTGVYTMKDVLNLSE